MSEEELKASSEMNGQPEKIWGCGEHEKVSPGANKQHRGKKKPPDESLLIGKKNCRGGLKKDPEKIQGKPSKGKEGGGLREKFLSSTTPTLREAIKEKRKKQKGKRRAKKRGGKTADERIERKRTNQSRYEK